MFWEGTPSTISLRMSWAKQQPRSRRSLGDGGGFVIGSAASSSSLSFFVSVMMDRMRA